MHFLQNRHPVQGFLFKSHIFQKRRFLGPVTFPLNPTVKTRFTHTAVGFDMAKVMRAKLPEGRELSGAFSTDSAHYPISDQAARWIDYQHPVGQPLIFLKKPGKMIGAIQDFHSSLHDLTERLSIRLKERVSLGNLLGLDSELQIRMYKVSRPSLYPNRGNS